MAERFAAQGDRVEAVGRDRLDVTDEQMVNEFFEQADPVDVLVNNAGVAWSTPLKRTTPEDWRGHLDVNATGPFLCTRAVIGGMIERGDGRIVTVASVAGLVGSRYTAAYTASKHAAIGLMRATAAELAGTGVTANAVCPIWVDTDMTRRTVQNIVEKTGRSAEEAEASLVQMTPLGRLLAPEEVAFAVEFFASPEAGRDQRPDARARRRRHPVVSPFRASAAFTEEWEHFDFTVEDGIATVTFSRPDKLNALTFDVYADLRDLVTELPHLGDVRVLVLTGEGRGFCSGGDVEEIIGELQRMSAGELLEFTRMSGAVVKAMRDCPIPIIASVNGVAAGAGAVLALAADLRLLASSAKFSFLFTKVGLAGADMGAAYLLPRLVGLGRATELLLLGGDVDPARATAIGLATRVVPDEELQHTTEELARQLADGPALAYATTKILLTRELDLDLGGAIEMEALAQALLMKSDDFGEFYAAWSEGRSPAWTGR